MYLKLILIFTSLSFIACNQANEKSIDQEAVEVPKINSINTSPKQLLEQGNLRFMEQRSIHPDQTLAHIKSIAKEQHPFATIISCSDSRVSPEIIFDQGLGDLFVIRTAGNVIGEYELASIEYATQHLHTPLVVVLGHKNCGAIKAYIDHKNDPIGYGHIQQIVDYIKYEPEEAALDENDPYYYLNAVIANINNGVHKIHEDKAIVQTKKKQKEFEVIGGIYDLENGKVEWIEP